MGGLKESDRLPPYVQHVLLTQTSPCPPGTHTGHNGDAVLWRLYHSTQEEMAGMGARTDIMPVLTGWGPAR